MRKTVALLSLLSVTACMAACSDDEGPSPSKDSTGGNGSGATGSGATGSGATGSGATGSGATGGTGGSGGSGGSTGGMAGGNVGGMAGSTLGGAAGMGGEGGAGETCSGDPTDVVINEIDADGDPEDWIELYNGTGNCIDLTGLILIDGDDHLDKDAYAFPSGSTIDAGGYLVVEGGEVDFSFGLSNNGEEVYLFTPEGTEIDSVIYEEQTGDSYARIGDGEETWAFIDTETKGTANPNAI